MGHRRNWWGQSSNWLDGAAKNARWQGQLPDARRALERLAHRVQALGKAQLHVGVGALGVAQGARARVLRADDRQGT